MNPMSWNPKTDHKLVLSLPRGKGRRNMLNVGSLGFGLEETYKEKKELKLASSLLLPASQRPPGGTHP